MSVMTFDKFISSQFENKSKMDYKLNFSRPDESKKQVVENHSKKQAQKGWVYFNNVDFGLSRRGLHPLLRVLSHILQVIILPSILISLISQKL